MPQSIDAIPDLLPPAPPRPFIEPRRVEPTVAAPEPHPRIEREQDVFDAAPGSIPFADYLEGQNLIDAARRDPSGFPPPRPAETGEGDETTRPAADRDRFEPAPACDSTAARIGDVLPVEPEPRRKVVERRYVVRHEPRPGSLLDVVI